MFRQGSRRGPSSGLRRLGYFEKRSTLRAVAITCDDSAVRPIGVPENCAAGLSAAAPSFTLSAAAWTPGCTGVLDYYLIRWELVRNGRIA